jgi:hypothetical protein
MAKATGGTPDGSSYVHSPSLFYAEWRRRDTQRLSSPRRGRKSFLHQPNISHLNQHTERHKQKLKPGGAPGHASRKRHEEEHLPVSGHIERKFQVAIIEKTVAASNNATRKAANQEPVTTVKKSDRSAFGKRSS